MSTPDEKRTKGGLPRGPSGLSRDEVASDQRSRLIEAMVKLAGERGYAATTVADLIGEAGVSRKTFYEHFEDRHELLLAAFDETAQVPLKEAQQASKRTGGSTRQLESVMRRLCRHAEQAPGAVALATIEVAAANPAGMIRHDKLMQDYGRVIDQCLRDEGGPSLPPTLARALAGGTQRTIDAFVRLGRQRELPELAPQLACWARSHSPVPEEIADAPEADDPDDPWPWVGGDGLVGGRAPGTLTLAPAGYRPRVGKPSTGFVQHETRERILDAVAQLNAEKGYTSLTATAIAERADVPERTFLSHFKSKDDAFSAAVEIGHAKGQAVVERGRSSGSDWRTKVKCGVRALVEFLASEPCFTRLAFVDAPLAGPAMAQRTHEHLAAYANLLFHGAPQRRRPPEVAPEAIVQGIAELAFHHAVQHSVVQLTRLTSLATYMALAPFLGVTDAAETAAE